MPLPLKARHPDLYADARDAHEASQQACTVARDLASTAMSTTNPVNLLAQVTAARRRAGELPGQSGLDAILDPETRTRFKEDYAAYEGIFAGGGITMPTPEELSRGGIDWARLAELKETYPDHDLVVAPLTLPLKQLRAVVRGVTNDRSIPGNPLKCYGGPTPYSTTNEPKERTDGLGVMMDIIEQWDNIMQATTEQWQAPKAAMAPEQGWPLTWTAFLVPYSKRSQSDVKKVLPTAMEKVVTVPLIGYISYQLRRIVDRQNPRMDAVLTQAVFEDNARKQAPAVSFTYVDGCLFLGPSLIGSDYVRGGLFTPIW